MGQYAEADLIDRKKLLEELGYKTEDDVGEAFDNAEIDEGEMFTIMSIFHAEKVDPCLIVDEYEKNADKEEKLFP